VRKREDICGSRGNAHTKALIPRYHIVVEATTLSGAVSTTVWLEM